MGIDTENATQKMATAASHSDLQQAMAAMRNLNEMLEQQTAAARRAVAPPAGKLQSSFDVPGQWDRIAVAAPSMSRAEYNKAIGQGLQQSALWRPSTVGSRAAAASGVDGDLLERRLRQGAIQRRRCTGAARPESPI